MRGEDYDSDLSITQHRQLLRLLQQTGPAFAEGDLPVDGVLDPLHLHLATHHLCRQPPTSLD